MTWEQLRYNTIKSILSGYHNNGHQHAHERIMACSLLTESSSQEEAYGKLWERWESTGDHFYQYQANKLAPK